MTARKKRSKQMQGAAALQAAFESAAPRPNADSPRDVKKNYAERLSRGITQTFADALRPSFPGILPDEHGKRHESKARTAKGFKRLDVNYSTTELGLALGVSVKTINFRDASSENYRKNYTRVDAELRAEAKDYHDRQPYSALVAVICLPSDSCSDDFGETPSSFGLAVKYFRNRGGRQKATDEAELFEAVYVGIYEPDGPERGMFSFFDTQDAPPRRGKPKKLFDFDELVERIRGVYDWRNDPPFLWDDDA